MLEAMGARLLGIIDENPTREGLHDTPKRWAKAMLEVTSGRCIDPSKFLAVTFTEEYDQIVSMPDIPFYSMCEHHLFPFFGSVDIAYMPDGKVFGASKFIRLVDCFSRRLQIQERMTQQIAEAIMGAGARGAAVVVRGRHLCMEMRGVRKRGQHLVTDAALGVFREDTSLKAEWLRMIQRRSDV